MPMARQKTCGVVVVACCILQRILDEIVFVSFSLVLAPETQWFRLFVSVFAVLEEGGVKMKLTIIDTPGFGDQINNENWWVLTRALDTENMGLFQPESGDRFKLL